MQKIWYIEVDNEIIRVQAAHKRTAMTEFHGEGYIVVWADVKLVPAWEKEKKSPRRNRGRILPKLTAYEKRKSLSVD